MLNQHNILPQRAEILVAMGFSPWFKKVIIKPCRLRAFNENKKIDSTRALGSLIEGRTIQRHELKKQENKLQLALNNNPIGIPDLKVGATKCAQGKTNLESQDSILF